MITLDELRKGVKGQKLVCKKNMENERFYNCELDGEKIETPTDKGTVMDLKDNEMNVTNSHFGVNNNTSFFNNNPVIRVSSGFVGRTDDYPGKRKKYFTVLKIRGIDD